MAPSPKRQKEEAARPAKVYAQTGMESLPLYSSCQGSHKPIQSLDGEGQSHIAEEYVAGTIVLAIFAKDQNFAFQNPTPYVSQQIMLISMFQI